MTPSTKGDLYGKTVSDLQSDIVVSDGAITGTLNYVTGYEGFNGLEVEEQSGNYLALDFTAVPWPDSLTVELVGGKKGPVALSELDDFCVFRITNKDTQTIQVVAKSGDETSTTNYSLSGLTLTPSA